MMSNVAGIPLMYALLHNHTLSNSTELQTATSLTLLHVVRNIRPIAAVEPRLT